MRATFTKRFSFSASFEAAGKLIAHNYVLAVTTDAVDRAAEVRLERQIDQALIEKIASRDWGLHVDFLKDIPLTDRRILEAFSQVLRPAISPLPLYALALEREGGASRTEIFLSPAK